MNLKDIKGKIEKKLPIKELVIFRYKESDYVAHQYIREYIDYSLLDFTLLDSLDTLKNSSSFLMDNIFIYKTDKFSCDSDKYKHIKNLFVICKSIDKKTEELYLDYIVDIPQLEKWQILDYIYFVCPTLGKKLESYVKILNNDIYAVENEVSKLSIFSKNKLEIDSATADEKMLPECILKAQQSDNAIFYLSGYTLFDLINALFTKDIVKLQKIYNSQLVIPPVLFYQLAVNTVEDIIKVVIDNTSTAEKLNMASNKYWAIKNAYSNCLWTKEKLQKILAFLVSLDKQIKTGKLTYNSLLVNLIITNILGEY